MTAPDPLWQFIRALPDRARADLNRSPRLVAAINRAVNDHGWTPEQLAERCGRNHGGATNIGAIVQHRLDEIDGPPPVAEGGRRVPFCSPECRDNHGLRLDPVTRFPVGKCSCREASA